MLLPTVTMSPRIFVAACVFFLFGSPPSSNTFVRAVSLPWWFINRSPREFVLRWLPRDRASDAVDGVEVGRVPPAISGHQAVFYSMNTYENDAFRLVWAENGAVTSDVFVRDAGKFGVLVIAPDLDEQQKVVTEVFRFSALKRDILSRGALTSSSSATSAKCSADAQNEDHGATAGASSSSCLSEQQIAQLESEIPGQQWGELVAAVSEGLPVLMKSSSDFAKMKPAEGSHAPDEMVVFNLASQPAELVAEVGSVRFAIPPAPTAAAPASEGLPQQAPLSMVRVKADANTAFVLSTGIEKSSSNDDSSSGWFGGVAAPSPLLEHKFSYPGELFLLVIAPDGKSVGTFMEDEMKVFFANTGVANECAPEGTSSSSDEDDLANFHKCLGDNMYLPMKVQAVPQDVEADVANKTVGSSTSAKEGSRVPTTLDDTETTDLVPDTRFRMPPGFVRTWFPQLWESVSHFRLCNVQPDTTPLREADPLTLPDGRTARVHVLRENPSVFVVEDVGTGAECAPLIARGGPGQLTRASVTSKGGYSKARRTLSRNMFPQYVEDETALSDDFEKLLRTLGLRFFNVTRQLTKYPVHTPGQEPINWLYYKAGYEYRPHCDGNCGLPKLEKGMRVCTTLLYCNEPERGGATVFPKDRIKYTPKEGSLLLFTYNPDPASLSFHSACPVLKGFKTTATQWYRLGVSAKDDWNNYLKRQ
ncbi:unnamed protein product [Amoebophrya sp. A120]|nr:unnamed protein product [Amoebophrya sp. A120]|eukprot:GSA120T00001918001.1